LLAYGCASEPVPAWVHGADLVACPPRPDGARACLGSRPGADATGISLYADDMPLFTVSDDLVLSFDYRAGPEMTWVGVWLKDRTSDSEQQGTLLPGDGTWKHVEVALTDVRPVGRNQVRMQPGDVITRLTIQGLPGSEQLQIANIAVRRVPGRPAGTGFLAAP
nr:hypothetical protein [Planctomycetota bacterium]